MEKEKEKEKKEKLDEADKQIDGNGGEKQEATGGHSEDGQAKKITALDGENENNAAEVLDTEDKNAVVFNREEAANSGIYILFEDAFFDLSKLWWLIKASWCKRNQLFPFSICSSHRNSIFQKSTGYSYSPQAGVSIVVYKVGGGSEILTKFWKFKIVIKLHIRLFGIEIFLADPDEYYGGLFYAFLTQKGLPFTN